MSFIPRTEPVSGPALTVEAPLTDPAPLPDASVPFVKMHGLGNDYVYLDERDTPVPDPPGLGGMARALADRHTGIGGDGLIILRRDDRYPCRMEMYNADGSRAEMCGNGIRCVARLAWERGHASSPRFEIATDSGPLQVEVQLAGDRVEAVRVAMGVAVFEEEDAIVEVGGLDFRGTILSLGNPHFVIEIDVPPAGYPVLEHGPLLEVHPRFPDRANIEFVFPRNRTELDFRVWERGSGETRACGTGATAAVAALHRRDRLDACATVHLPGGDLFVEVAEDGATWMTGPAEESFRGHFPLSLVQHHP